MNKVIFILGGVRSGKSKFAMEMAKKYKNVTFIATLAPKDKEVRERIREHKKVRPKSWKTIEETKNLIFHFEKEKRKVILIDCLTVFISNLLLLGRKESYILNSIEKLAKKSKKRKKTTIFVANEVGLGVVPGSELGRTFRDIAGRANQIIAEFADEVYFLISGIPMKLK